MRINKTKTLFFSYVKISPAHKSLWFTVSIVLCIILSGCNEPIYLKNPKCDRVTTTCSFQLASINDVRRNKKSVGKITDHKIVHDELQAWLTNGFSSIGILSDTVTDETLPIINLDVDVECVHIRSVTTSMTSNVVLKIRYNYQSDILDEKTYRGTHVAVNWMSGKGDIQKCFDLALKDSLKKIAAEANTICHIFTTCHR